MGNILPWTSDAAARQAIVEIQEKREKRFEEARNRVENQDPALREAILSLSLVELRDALQNDRYNAQTVLAAYAWKALQVQETHNCVCQFLIESFDEAEAADKKFSHQDHKPPLYGLPFSVKENCFLKGYDSCIGLTKYLNKPCQTDCTMVTHLRSLGAIPFVIANVPQTLLSLVCSNPVYGTTGNPKNVHRTPGGSSGGDACLTALGGTSFGTGNDLAGSLRIPASMCGVVGFKPTQDRYVVHNLRDIPGRGRLGLSFGFFTKRVEEQVLLWEHVFGSEDYRKLVPECAPVPYRAHLYTETTGKKSLRIGYFTNDGFLRPTPGCERVVQETVDRLRAEGHELVRFRVPTPDQAVSILYKCMFFDGGTFIRNLYSNEIVDPHMKEFVMSLKIPKIVRWLASYALSSISPQASAVIGSYVQTVDDVRLAHEACDEYVEEFTSLWHELQIDALVCPAFAVPSVPHENGGKLSACVFATGLYNLLDYPAGIVPVDCVTKEDDAHLMDEESWPTGNNFVLKFVRNAAANSEGLPLAVQVVTLPYEEEKCLGVMKIIENLWK
ncbi:amidase domain-containing protein [Ditylenchus destructor]|nr:amidase domain-containing protein [Ditylenchus destructor]